MSENILCARCGAPLPPSAASEVVTCAFCGASSAPKPRVVERVVERIVVVPARGGAAPAPGTLHCPRCGDSFRDAPTRDTTLRVCRSCGGVWVDAKTIERLTRERDDDLANVARRAIGAFAPQDRDRRPEIACPVCSASLGRRDVGDGGRAIDACAEHGTFFDYGELPAFIEAEAERRAGDVSDDDVEAAGLKKRWF